MAANFFSPAWYRVADLRVRMRRHANIHRHTYRGRTWYVVQDHATGQLHRFTPEAYELIGRMDGRRRLQEIWDEGCAMLGDLMPSQHEVIALVSQLYQANLLHTDGAVDIGDLQLRRRKTRRRKVLQILTSPMGIRVPLFDPDKFLERTKRFIAPLFGVWGALLWFAAVAFACVLAAVHWNELTENLSDRIFALENLTLMALVYPFVKTFHELGHAYAVKRWGGEVHDIGIMLLVFYPVPYVDASASAAFRSKWERAAVGSAGIIVEMFIAALAMMAWTAVEQGLVRAVAMNVVIVASVSTLIFNGNPLLRFDAYYVLSDLLEIPNLAQRGNRQIGYLIKRYLLRVRDLSPPAFSTSEAWWLSGYAALSFLYRLFVVFAISIFVTLRYAFFGVALMLWFISMMLLYPMAKLALKPLTDSKLRPMKGRIYAGAAVAMTALVFFLFAVPVPFSTHAEGMVWVEDNAVIRAGSEGFVDAILATPESSVAEGDVLLRLANPETQSRVRVLAAQLEQARLEQRAARQDASRAQILSENVRFFEEQLAAASERERGLTVASGAAGAFLLPNAADIGGKYIRRGERLGVIADPDRLIIVVLIPEASIDDVRNRNSRAFVRFVSDRTREIPAQFLRTVPASTTQLPSRVLSADGGGPFALDPRAQDGLTSFEPFYRAELRVDDMAGRRIEERAYVVFRHDPEPIGWRWYRGLRQLFLRRLGV